MRRLPMLARAATPQEHLFVARVKAKARADLQAKRAARTLSGDTRSRDEGTMADNDDRDHQGRAAPLCPRPERPFLALHSLTCAFG